MAEMNDVPIAHATVFRRVLAHRRDDNAIGQLKLADTDRLEQFGICHRSLPLGADIMNAAATKSIDSLRLCAGSVMPFFRKTEISDKDLEALAGYCAARSYR